MAFLTSQHRNGDRRRGLYAFPVCRNWAARTFFILATFLTLFGVESSAVSAEGVSREYPLKAVFLLNFARFTDWPTNAFDRPESPLVIGILGSDPFGPMLDLAIENEQVKGRKFVIERYPRLADLRTCHILFIGQSEINHLDKIETELKTRPILTVSDIENSAERGVCEQFITENNKIRLRINTDSLKIAKLTVSSKVLRLAEIISGPPK
jgi:hypothetical protein